MADEKTGADEPLSEAAQKELLGIARRVIEAAAKGEPTPDCRSEHPELQAPVGAFVTLNEGEHLRGCIGRFVSDEPLWKVVVQMARASATEDPRFPPLAERELPRVTIEISVLSRMKRTRDPLSLELGVHGIYIRSGWRSGTFLPQVATEHHMSKEEFLSSCCAHKAGLPPDAWKDPGTEVYLYTAQVFGEG